MSQAADAAMAARDGFAVWEGVYASFAEAPAEGPGFDGPQWRARSVAAARQALAAIARGEALDYSLTQRNAALPPLVAILLTRQPRVRVLDFGGGPGLGYLVLKRAMSDALARIDHVVVDSPAICETGAALFGAEGPAFRESIPSHESFDIAHAASVLQYVGDWQGAIASLAASRPAMLSFGDIFAGTFDSCVTLQNYYGSRIRHWLFNLDDFVGAVESNGYRLTMRLPCHVEVLGRRGPLPMDHLPADMRIAHTHHLLFARESEAL
jgi:putative methyltransferase (TIGR04325 family)